MPLSRRDFLARTTVALAAGAAGAGCSRSEDGNDDVELDAAPNARPLPRPALLRNADDWD